MGKTCSRQAPQPRIPKAALRLSAAPPSFWQGRSEGSPPWGPALVPGQVLPGPCYGPRLGASPALRLPGQGLFIAEGLIVCVFQPPHTHTHTGLLENRSPGAGSPEEPRPEKGTIKSRGEGVNRALAPSPTPTLCTIHQEINKKWFVSICPQKNTRISSGWSGLSPKAPLNPRGAGQEGGPGVGRGLSPSFRSQPSCPLQNLQPAGVSQGS